MGRLKAIRQQFEARHEPGEVCGGTLCVDIDWLLALAEALSGLVDEPRVHLGSEDGKCVYCLSDTLVPGDWLVSDSDRERLIEHAADCPWLQTRELLADEKEPGDAR